MTNANLLVLLFLNVTFKNHFSEPVKFIGEGQYNLDSLQYVEVTKSYIGLGQKVIKCQNVESFYNCTTKFHIDNILEYCSCLPFTIRVSNKVIK